MLFIHPYLFNTIGLQTEIGLRRLNCMTFSQLINSTRLQNDKVLYLSQNGKAAKLDRNKNILLVSFQNTHCTSTDPSEYCATRGIVRNAKFTGDAI